MNNFVARWIREQHDGKRDQLWTAGLQDYISHGQKLIAEFQDVLDGKTASNGNTAPSTGAPMSPNNC